VSDSDARALALAEHYLRIEHPRQALEALDGAEGEALADESYWLLRARALRGLRRPHEAAAAAERGLELDPAHPVLLDLLCLARLELGDLVGARRAIRAALEEWPGDADLLAHAAMVEAKAGAHGEAARLLAQATEADPEAREVLHARAYAAYVRGDDAAADADYLRLLRQDPESVAAHRMRGAVLARMGEWDGAERHLREAAARAPGDVEIVDAARRLRALAHPLMRPLRPVARLGRWRIWLAWIAIYGILRATGNAILVAIAAAIWLVFVAYTWIVPPLVRWWVRRRAP
jgi:tetratricopeptide (TPR) repeat protein